VRLEKHDKLLKPTFPISPYIERAPHTLINSPSPGAGTLNGFKRSQSWGSE